MLLTPHVAVGSAVGLATGNPVLGFFAGWATHHICDLIPHVDSGSDGVEIDTFFAHKEAYFLVFTDIALAIVVLIILLVKTNFSNLVFWGAFGGIFPDLVDNVPFWSIKIRKLPFFKQLHSFHEKFQYTVKNKNSRWIGWATQAIFLGGAFVFVFTR